jgi:hypothetical protein
LSRTFVRDGLAAVFDPQLVDEMFDAHSEAKRNYHAGGLRLSAVEGGRFCEAAYRILQQETTTTFTPLGKELDSEKVMRHLAQLPSAAFSDSVRLHIPRSLRLIYDIRNKRDAAHLADGIDPNLQDATLVIAVIDWVLAEFVRMHHQVPPNIARQLVEDLVTRSTPSVEDFDGFLKVLRADIQASEMILLLLYQRGRTGASFIELRCWVRAGMRKNLARTIARLVDDKAYVHERDGTFVITQSGQRYVEGSGLAGPLSPSGTLTA